MVKITFRAWLKTQSKEQSPVGDFARDVKQDRDFPKEQDHDVIRAYLDSLASDLALDAFEQAWSMWDQSEISHPLDQETLQVQVTMRHPATGTEGAGVEVCHADAPYPNVHQALRDAGRQAMDELLANLEVNGGG